MTDTSAIQKVFSRINLTPSQLLFLVCSSFLVIAGALFFGLKGFALTLGAVLFLVLAWFILLRPSVGLVIIAFVLPFERFGSIELSGFTFRASQLFLVITIIATIVHVLRGKIILRFHGVYVALLLFFVGSAFSLAFASNLFRGVTTILFTLFTLSLVVIIPALIDSKEKLLLVLKSLLLGAIVTSAFGVFQFVGDLAGFPQEITGLRDLYTKEVFGFPRIQSTALEPLYFANYLLLPIALSIVVFFKKIRELMPYAIVLIPLSLPVFVLTLSRAAFIAGALMFILLGFVFLRRVLKPTYIVLIIMLGLATFFGVTYALSLTGDEEVSVQTFSSHVTNLFAGASFADRASTNLQAIELATHNPQGVGPGNFGPAISHNPLIEPKGGWLIVNNVYLEVLAETGIIGFVGYLSFIVLVIVLGVRSFLRRTLSVTYRYILLAVVASCIAISVQYMTFSIVYIMHIWFTFGLFVLLLPEKINFLHHES